MTRLMDGGIRMPSAAGGQAAQEQRLVVAVLADLRNGHHAHRGGGRHAGAGSGREQRGRAERKRENSTSRSAPRSSTSPSMMNSGIATSRNSLFELHDSSPMARDSGSMENSGPASGPARPGRRPQEWTGRSAPAEESGRWRSCGFPDHAPAAASSSASSCAERTPQICLTSSMSPVTSAAEARASISATVRHIQARPSSHRPCESTAAWPGACCGGLLRPGGLHHVIGVIGQEHHEDGQRHQRQPVQHGRQPHRQELVEHVHAHVGALQRGEARPGRVLI